MVFNFIFHSSHCSYIEKQASTKFTRSAHQTNKCTTIEELSPKKKHVVLTSDGTEEDVHSLEVNNRCNITRTSSPKNQFLNVISEEININLLNLTSQTTSFSFSGECIL
ncbi:hypothetical protein DAI22_03g057701 [Oryza sativa Japonica Group]|nr:hypothetical protein DAI22_03g057701 [Oryza sativa Japonica Group]